MNENRRKCFKCGCSPAEHNVKLFRFPKPGVQNLIRCLLWARYIYPEGQYSSLQIQRKLYSDHKMLCEKHFKDTDFKDITKAQLLRTAVPCELRCELWAKFCFPLGKWSSPDFQMKLYNEHRMLCHTHFKESSYVDFTTKKLSRHAAPEENFVQIKTIVWVP